MDLLKLPIYTFYCEFLDMEERFMKKVFIGIDVGKFKNSISIIDSEGNPIIKKGISIENDYYGFAKLEEKIDLIMNNYGFTYEDCIAGVESTGHYWFNLRDYLKDIGIETVMIKTDSVKHRRALEEGQKGKNDTLDARVIASCLRNGNYVYIRDNERELRALQKLTRMRNDISDELVALKNKIHRCIDICNPVFFKIFENLNSKTGVALIKLYPSPQDIINVELDNIKKELGEIVDKPNMRMVSLYKEECEIWSGLIKEPSYAEKVEMIAYIDKFLLQNKSKEHLDKQIKEIAKNIIPLYSEFEEIKGIPLIQLISVLSEIGDIRNFKNTRAILAFLGLSLKGNASGKYIGERKINKAGSRIVRKHLFNIMESLIKHNEYFRVAYCYYKSYRHKDPTKKRSMQIAVMCKFVRVMYGMLKYNASFDYKEMMKGYYFGDCNMQVFKEEFEGENRRKKIENCKIAYDIYTIYS